MVHTQRKYEPVANVKIRLQATFDFVAYEPRLRVTYWLIGRMLVSCMDRLGNDWVSRTDIGMLCGY